MLYLLPTTLHTFLSDTSAHWNKHKCLPHNSSLLCPLSLPPALPHSSPSSSLFPSPCATAIYRRPSISPACQRAFSFGLLLQGARRWQITTRQPVIFDLSEPPPPPHTLRASSSISLYPTSACHTHYPHQRQSRQHSNSSSHRCRTNLHTPLLPPTFHIFHFDQRRKFSSQAPRQKKRKKWGKKEILWQWKHLGWRGSSSCIIT